jgi:hypothetical protein
VIDKQMDIEQQIVRASMKGADVLAEIEDIIRTMPARQVLNQDVPETFSWMGRAIAALSNWSIYGGARARALVTEMQKQTVYESHQGFLGLMVLLEEARADLRMNTLGPINTAIGQGEVFDYFDEIRRIISLATSDLLFVDPYLDADFVSRYPSRSPDRPHKAPS